MMCWIYRKSKLVKWNCIRHGKPVSDEEFKEIFDSYINGTYLHKRLEKVQAHKQKLLSKIANLETVEQEIQNQIAKNN
jgi:hypothetical protein